MTLRANILGVAVWGPGLEGWAASRPILAGAVPYAARDVPPPPSTLLPPTERRRSGPVVRLALTVAQEAVAMSGRAPDSLRAVFASSNGDGPVVGTILEALSAAGSERVVSPTQFHNSVHNAAAGYWSIATASRQPASCIGCHDDTFAAGLLTAMAETCATGAPVLLCCYDHPLPPPIAAHRATGAPFGVALVLAPGQAAPQLTLTLQPGPVLLPELAEPALAALAARNPAARALPVLAALASGRAAHVQLPYLDMSLGLELTP